MAKLTDVLGQHPPPQPSRPAVDLLVTVGQQQEYLLFHNLLPPPGHPGALDALQARTRIPQAAHSATNFMVSYSTRCLDDWQETWMHSVCSLLHLCMLTKWLW